MVQPKGNWR